MPDLTIETRRVCMDNEYFELHVDARNPHDGPGGYMVTYCRANPGPYGANWSCTCPGFKYRKTCRHIKEADDERCNAGHDAYCGGAGLGDVDKCPKCGGDTIVIQIAT